MRDSLEENRFGSKVFKTRSATSYEISCYQFIKAYSQKLMIIYSDLVEKKQDRAKATSDSVKTRYEEADKLLQGLEEQITIMFELTSVNFIKALDTATSLLKDSLSSKGDKEEDWKDSKEQFVKSVTFIQKFAIEKLPFGSIILLNTSIFTFFHLKLITKELLPCLIKGTSEILKSIGMFFDVGKEFGSKLKLDQEVDLSAPEQCLYPAGQLGRNLTYFLAAIAYKYVKSPETKRHEEKPSEKEK